MTNFNTFKIFKNRILDTHLFYEAAGLLDKQFPDSFSLTELSKNCERIVLTPLNVIEILSTVSEGNFKDKQKIVKEFVKIPHMFTGPDNYFRSAWGLRLDKEEDDLMLFALNKFLNAKDFQSIKSDTDFAREKKVEAYKGFSQSVVENIDTVIPGFKQARIDKKMLTPDKETRKKLKEIFISNEGFDHVLMTTRSKLPEFIGVNELNPTIEEIEQAKIRLSFYVKMYLGYLVKSLSNAPEPNDFGDLEQLIYLSKDCQFITREKKWLQIAEENGLQDYVICPDAI